MLKKYRYIIYTGSFDENIGGIILLHSLCDRLNSQGEKAFIWPCCYDLNGGREFKTFYKFNTPLIDQKVNLEEYIVIYPEIINGNPLVAPNVVRWFLNRPGELTGNIDYGDNELYFYHTVQFNDETINPNQSNRLYVQYFRSDIYEQTNFGKRTGSCYILRKGKQRGIYLNLHRSDSVLLDGLSHKECADIFNRVKYCISYDLYTAYSRYAVVCGCISIVIPSPSLSKLQWRPDETYRYGIAYGFDDIKYACNTRDKVIENLNVHNEERVKKDIASFINKTQSFFVKTYKTFEELSLESSSVIDESIYNKIKFDNYKIVVFGASKSMSHTLSQLSYYNITVDFVVDNDEEKIGTTINGYLVMSPYDIFFEYSENHHYIVFIASMFFKEISRSIIHYSGIDSIYRIHFDHSITKIYDVTNSYENKELV